MITYRSLLTNLQAMTPQQLDQHVSVFVRGVDEFYSLDGKTPIDVARAEDNDVLDPGHLFLVI